MQAKLKNIGVLVGFLVVCLVARRLNQDDGRSALAVGAVAGYLLGAAIALWGLEYQKYIARTRPAAIWQAFTVSFLSKFLGLGIGPMIALLLPSVGERCNWGALMIGYGFAAVLVLLLGSREISRALKTPSNGSNRNPSDNSNSHSSTRDSLTSEQAPLESRTCI